MLNLMICFGVSFVHESTDQHIRHRNNEIWEKIQAFVTTLPPAVSYLCHSAVYWIHYMCLNCHCFVEKVDLLHYYTEKINETKKIIEKKVLDCALVLSKNEPASLFL